MDLKSKRKHLSGKKKLGKVSSSKKNPFLLDSKKTLVLNSKKILKKKSIANTSFIGDGFDLLFGLIYLARKHKNLSIPISFTHNYGIKRNEIIDIMDAGLRFDCTINENKQKLYYPINIKDFYGLIKKSRKRFHAIFIYIKWNCRNNAAHFNMLVFDKLLKTVERFEPYTKLNNTKSTIVVNNFDKKLEKDIKKYLNYEYLNPNQFCPIVGFQQKEENNLLYSNNNIDILKGKTSGSVQKKTDPGGFCGAWSLYFLDLKLTFPNYKTSIIMDKAFKALENDKHSFRSFIRNYSNFIVNKRSKLLKQYNYTSNTSESNSYSLLQNKFTELIKRK